MKGIQSLDDQKSLQSIDEDHVEKTFDEGSKDQRKTKTIGIDQIIVLEKTLVNLISQQVMNKYLDHGYTIS